MSIKKLTALPLHYIDNRTIYVQLKLNSTSGERRQENS